MKPQNLKLALVAASLTVLALSPALQHPLLSFAAYALFSPVCHQDPARSFWIFSVPVAVCARCLGIYAGAALGALVSTDRRIAITAFFCAAILNAADVLTESVGVHGNLMSARFLLGFALGCAITAVLSADDKKKYSLTIYSQ